MRCDIHVKTPIYQCSYQTCIEYEMDSANHEHSQNLHIHTHTLIYSNNSWLLFCSLSFAFAFAFSTVYFICESGDGWHFLSRMYALSRLKQALNVCSKFWHTSECDNTAIKRNSAMQRTQAHRMCAQIFSPMRQRKFLLMHKMYAKKITLRFDYTDRRPCRVLFTADRIENYNCDSVSEMRTKLSFSLHTSFTWNTLLHVYAAYTTDVAFVEYTELFFII